jgi:hypothetical protein
MDITVGKARTIFTYLLVLSGCLWLYGCDVLGEDVDPDDPLVEITGKEVYMTADGSGYIDLYAMVKTQGTVRLDIISQPRKGTLSKMADGLLQYTPAGNFKKGRDSFKFLIYSQNNRLLKEDSVSIIVENDSTNLPPGIYPQDDFVYNVTGAVTINVLRNDILGADSTQVGVEIYRPGQHFPPHRGTATVVAGNMIRYTPGNNFNGSDSVFYRVYSLADTTKSGIAKIVIAPAQSCEFSLFNDHFVFDTDTIASDSLQLNVFQNDQLCAVPVSSYQVTLLNDGSEGTAFYNNAGGLRYTFPDTVTRSFFRDSIIYQMCYAQRCKAAKVYIEVHL